MHSATSRAQMVHQRLGAAGSPALARRGSHAPELPSPIFDPWAGLPIRPGGFYISGGTRSRGQRAPTAQLLPRRGWSPGPGR
eukprot:8604160-Alexandrium_andersonii.AAC.1